ncbi:MAG TPA: translocation/assembly module TamB domain-containing protein, partial [Pseudoxanthomonas sp.]|nr:translocation/assembly module TamB domain-containing protein [Pseudoxanthomonas sp.]
GRTPARLGLVARGNRQSMDMGLAGNAPAPVRVMLGVRGEENPTWSFSGKTESLDLALLGLVEDSMPLAFDLKANGAGGAADLQGRVTQGDFTAVLEPSKISIADEVLTVEPLAVRAFDGLTTLRGRADFRDPENPVFKFSANARGLRWGGVAAGAGKPAQGQIMADADLGFAGQMKAWAAIGKATLVREEQKATVDFDGSGNGEQLVLNKLLATMPTGTLDATGTVGWEPQLRWDVGAKLAGFDPGYFLADWKGNVSGDLASKGQARETGGFDATLDVPKLGGSLRGRKLDGRGTFALHGDEGDGELALALGNSRVDAKGKIGDTLDIDANLHPLHLDDLLPDASGSVAGTLKLTGKRDAPNVDADLSGSGVKWSGYSAETLSVRGRLPWRGSGGDLAIRGSAVNVGMVLDSVRVDARGAVENLQFDGDASNTMGSISLAGSALKRGANWQGSLDALQLTPSKGSSWRLQQSARYTQNGAAFMLTPACLAASGGGALCAEANWPKQGLQLHADALPLTLVQPWLPPANGRPLTLRGDIELDAFIKPAGKAWLGEVHLSSLDGGLKMGNNARGEIVRYDNFTLDAEFNPQTIKGRLGTGFKGDGYVDATIATGWDEFAPLKGDIYFNNSRLFWLELFSPDLVRPTGDLRGHVGLAGTRGTPALSGDAQLTAFKGELPSLGITLTDGTVNLDAQSDGSATINGTLKSVSSTGGTVNGGTLSVDGTLDWKVEGAPLQFNIRGTDFLVADTTDLTAVASPDLQVAFADNTIQVRGKVVVPSASIDVESLDDGVSVSEDVVVLDPVDPERVPSSRLDLDLAITLGDAVKLKGYGLDGALAGTLNVRSRVGREMVATGRLDVDGRYTAYGQKLLITRGELSWSNSAVSDPRINIRAEREVVSSSV